MQQTFGVQVTGTLAHRRGQAGEEGKRTLVDRAVIDEGSRQHSQFIAVMAFRYVAIQQIDNDRGIATPVGVMCKHPAIGRMAVAVHAGTWISLREWL